MTRKKVFITKNIPVQAIDFLRENFDVEVNEKEGFLSKETLLEKVQQVDAVLCLLTDSIDKKVIEFSHKVKIFANYAVGYNNIDVEAAKQKGIVVTNTPDVLTNATADLAWSLLFGVARRVVEGDKFTRNGLFKEWTPTLFLGQEITGKTLGIFGAGRIGKAFAKRSMGFEMKIVYHNRNRNIEFEKETGALWVSKEDLLKQSDFVSIHVPLTSDTMHLIGEKEFSLMKKNVILINTARGPVVDEKALVQALEKGQIWGAGLDVYEKEPEIEEKLKSLDNVILLPHIGSATFETRTKMAMMAAENITSVLTGKEPLNPVK